MLEFEFKGQERITRRVDEIRARLNAAHPLMDEAGRISLLSIRRNFDVSGRPAWPGFAPSTLAGLVGPRRLLIASGALRRSFRMSVSSNQVEVGTNTTYAKYHQHGTRNIPARPFLLLQTEDELQIGRALRRHVTG